MKRWIGYGLVVGLFLSAACDDEGDLCDAECDCEGCSEVDYDRCVNEYDSKGREADFRGCPDLYADYVDCRQATYYCAGADFRTSCGAESDRLERCIH